MIPSIAIVGGGVAGWMTAAALANALKGRSLVQLIETAADPPPDLAEAATPQLSAFHAGLGIDEDQLVRATQATFKLGTSFADWPRSGRRFFHPFGDYGTSIDTVGFHHCWLRLRELGDETELAAYSLAAVAAALCKFERPSPDPNSVLSSFAYGLHLDGQRYLDHIRAYALARGVLARQPRFAAASLRSQDGSIEALVLESGDRIAADLFVDCTDQGLLIGQALGVGWEDWSKWLACDRVVAAASASADDLPPYTQVVGGESGWRWRMALQNRVADGYVYCSGLLSDDAAAEALIGAIGARALDAPAFRRFNSGRRQQFWSRNCVALGPAAAALEPIEGTNLHLIQSAIERLIALLPGGGCEDADSEEYNRLSIAEIERLRDFLILHHHAAATDAELPDALRYKIEGFKARGRVVPYAGEIFQTAGWLSVLDGMEVRPRRRHPFADGIDLGELKARMHALRTVIGQAARAMPTHQEFIARNCCADLVPAA
jgi:tryptophan halogenase